MNSLETVNFGENISPTILYLNIRAKDENSSPKKTEITKQKFLVRV
jgi:hypothetical protein